MKEFTVEIEITKARVYQTYLVRAHSKDDAVNRVELGEGDLRSTDIEDFDEYNLHAVHEV